MHKVVIIGCGDIGRRIGRLAIAEGCEVSVLARSQEKADLLAEEGFCPYVGDLNDASLLPAIPLAQRTVFYLAPPPGGGFQDSRVRQFCAAFSRDVPERLVYLGTSGVYGDCGTRPVVEDDAVEPTTARARRRYDAEQCFTAWGQRHGVAVMRARVANIYGPGRLPIVHLKAGHPLLREDQSPATSRVHCDDLARALWLIADTADAGEVFNVADCDPCSMTVYFKVVARQLGLSVPPEVSLERAREIMKPLLLNYFTESRIMNSGKIMNKLGFELSYPTLLEGLHALK